MKNIPANYQPHAPQRQPGYPGCPRCGSQNFRSGPWPWYLGSIGAIIVRAVVCNQCGHHFDLRKPHADLQKRKRNLAIMINGFGAFGILMVILGVVALIYFTSRH